MTMDFKWQEAQGRQMVHAAAVKADGSGKPGPNHTRDIGESKMRWLRVTPILSLSTRNSHQHGRRR